MAVLLAGACHSAKKLPYGLVLTKELLTIHPLKRVNAGLSSNACRSSELILTEGTASESEALRPNYQ